MEMRSRFLLTVCLIGTVLRFADCLVHNPLDALTSDMEYHWQNAVRFLDPAVMQEGTNAILYQVYLFLVRMVTGESRIGVGIVSGMLSALTPWLYYRAALACNYPRNAALTCWALIAWLPSFFVIYRYLMAETLLLTLIGLSLWVSAIALARTTLGWFLLMTACWTLACLTKLHPGPAALVCWLFVLRRLPRPLCAATASFVLIGCMLVPNAIRTSRILGYVAPFGDIYFRKTHHESNKKALVIHCEGLVWTFMSPSAYDEPLEPLCRWKLDREGSYEFHVNKENGEEDWRKAYEKSRRSLAVWSRNLGENLILFNFCPSWPDCPSDCLEGRLNYDLRWIWCPLFLWTIIGNLRQFARGQFPLVPAACTAMLLTLMLQNSFIAEGRWRKPVEPLVLLNCVWLAARLRNGGIGAGDHPRVEIENDPASR